MASKLINREITNIIANYLYNRPFKSLNPTEPTDTAPSAYKSINRPLDLFLRTYFTNHKYLGGSERSAISDKVYNLVRYEYLLSHLIRSKPYTIEKEYTFNDQL